MEAILHKMASSWPDDIKILTGKDSEHIAADIIFYSSPSFLLKERYQYHGKALVAISNIGCSYRDKIKLRSDDLFYSDDQLELLMKKVRKLIHLYQIGKWPNELPRHTSMASLTNKERCVINQLIQGVNVNLLADQYGTSTKIISAIKRSAVRKLNATTMKSLLDVVSLSSC